MLLVLSVCGLFVAFIFSLFSGPAPWYAWVICGLVLPVGVMLLAIMNAIRDSWQSRGKSKLQYQSKDKAS